MAKVPVSILIPVRNEERNLDRCLRSVAWADEIVVVDSQSTDKTVEIATAAGARVVQFIFNGTWPKKKNWALENIAFKHPWVFILDADEVLARDAEAEFRGIVTRADLPYEGYWINRKFMFLGEWLAHAYYPNWNLRLFLHTKGRFEKITDKATNSGDNEVHEHLVLSGRTANLKTEMQHFAFPSIDTFVEKHNRYSNWEAIVKMGGASPDLQHSDVRLKRIVRRWMRKMPFRPLLRFLYVYIYQKGFLDGRRGYLFARLHGFYEFLCVAKEFEAKLKSNDDATPRPPKI